MLTDKEIEQRKIIVKAMLKGKKSFVSRYGVNAEKVMYGTATSQLKNKREK